VFAEVMTMLLLRFFAYQLEPTKRLQCWSLKELPTIVRWCRIYPSTYAPAFLAFAAAAMS
jgi:hypothetical protein